MPINRRRFVTGVAATSMALASQRLVQAANVNSKVVLALMGANDRGSQLAHIFAKHPHVEIAYVCDPDQKAVQKGIEAVTSEGRPAPRGIADFRQALDDGAVDALVCAAPNHWHAAATIAACSAGKHVYVEKPCSHTPEEGEMLIAAVRESERVVQVGMQRRSGTLYHEVKGLLKSGIIGKVLLYKAWYYRNRPSIGRGRESVPPEGLDYSLWQGPAPACPYRDNILHYNWHFFWHWGNGELGNNGVHTLDVCRELAEVDYPKKVTSTGSRIRYDDDQQTPDTIWAGFDCDGCRIVWEAVSWSQPIKPDDAVGIEVRGTEGTMEIRDSGYRAYDMKGNLLQEGKGSRGDREHINNFIECIQNSSQPNADIVEGHKSAMFCHLGNISLRCERTLNIDPTNGHILNDVEASAYWTKEYRPGWSPKELS